MWRRISPKREIYRRNADMCSVAGPSSSGSGDLLELLLPAFTISPLLVLLASILDLSVTTTTVTSSCLRSNDITFLGVKYNGG